MNVIISAVTHRTGSTLMQRIFNMRKKTLIWGEHYGMVNYFCEIYSAARSICSSEDSKQEHQNYFAGGENPNIWIANMNPDVGYADRAIINSVQAFFDAFYSQYRESHDLIGFKEVRYGEAELSLLRRCYPEVKFVLLIRNPVDVWMSMPHNWKEDIQVFLHKWNSNTRYYLRLAKSDSKAHLFLYEDVVQQKKQTLELLAELARVTAADIKNVLSHKLFSTRSRIPEKDRQYIIEQCADNMKQLGYL
ncbi:MAG: sulfotransferase [Thermoanaerobacteraceae bacterium]|nr:sulfotransferase [Thermoanaerobacteraceae bacterium]